MITIKDIALKAGTSVSTVSIILNGKARERKISPQTEDRVKTTIRELGYQPNLSAKLLRENKQDQKFYILVLWTSDSREMALINFLHGLHMAIKKNSYPCEIIFKPYKYNFLCDAMADDILRMCHGCIVCHASLKDIEYLENNDISKPIVICDRTSKKYPTIILEYEKFGIMASDIFARHGRRRPALISEPLIFEGLKQISDNFEQNLEKRDIRLSMKRYSENTIRNGYKCMNALLDEGGTPDSLFCTSDLLAFGAMRALHERSVKIPQDVEIIALGIGAMEQEEFYVPSLSVLYAPIDKITDKSLMILYDLITYSNDNVTKMDLKITPKYYARESCGK